MRPSAFTDGNSPSATARRSRWCFNEAVGFHRRKRRTGLQRGTHACVASMRPSAFTDGNQLDGRRADDGRRASMRPSAFTDGNTVQDPNFLPLPLDASMRPSAFTDGNVIRRATVHRGQRTGRFNEAVGFHRRKLVAGRWRAGRPVHICFNEAVGFHRRKHIYLGWGLGSCQRFNEAVGFHRRKHHGVNLPPPGEAVLQ